MSVEFKAVTSFDDLVKALTVRGIVFCGEQGIPYSFVRDHHDCSSIHVLGEDDGEPIASGRIRIDDGYAKLERVAVRESNRGKYYGQELVKFMVSIAEKKGAPACKLHAQAYLKDYYLELGFEVQGEKFLEAGIEHYRMIRE